VRPIKRPQIVAHSETTRRLDTMPG
jgi:hypothetical protein